MNPEVDSAVGHKMAVGTTTMLRSLFEVIIESGLQAVGWAVLKGLTLGRWIPTEDILLEWAVGLAVLGAVGYGVYRALTL